MRQFTGIVIKKMAKTVKVLVTRIKVHPLYKKQMRIKKSYHVHDEIGTKKGDRVKFRDCRPISKTKKWQIVEIVKEKERGNDTARKRS
ncbi:MAG: 30S ribosomal protein S17 [Candidatus Shapirobacteria bacterium]|nr:30S ribosomal protein S17 [Candidatus Shapirobacteria bacterium]